MRYAAAEREIVELARHRQAFRPELDFSALTPHAGLLAQQLMEPKVATP